MLFTLGEIDLFARTLDEVSQLDAQGIISYELDKYINQCTARSNVENRNESMDEVKKEGPTIEDQSLSEYGRAVRATQQSNQVAMEAMIAKAARLKEKTKEKGQENAEEGESTQSGTTKPTPNKGKGTKTKAKSGGRKTTCVSIQGLIDKPYVAPPPQPPKIDTPNSTAPSSLQSQPGATTYAMGKVSSMVPTATGSGGGLSGGGGGRASKAKGKSKHSSNLDALMEAALAASAQQKLTQQPLGHQQKQLHTGPIVASSSSLLVSPKAGKTKGSSSTISSGGIEHSPATSLIAKLPLPSPPPPPSPYPTDESWPHLRSFLLLVYLALHRKPPPRRVLQLPYTKPSSSSSTLTSSGGRSTNTISSTSNTSHISTSSTGTSEPKDLPFVTSVNVDPAIIQAARSGQCHIIRILLQFPWTSIDVADKTHKSTALMVSMQHIRGSIRSKPTKQRLHIGMSMSFNCLGLLLITLFLYPLMLVSYRLLLFIVDYTSHDVLPIYIVLLSPLGRYLADSASESLLSHLVQIATKYHSLSTDEEARALDDLTNTTTTSTSSSLSSHSTTSLSSTHPALPSFSSSVSVPSGTSFPATTSNPPTLPLHDLSLTSIPVVVVAPGTTTSLPHTLTALPTTTSHVLLPSSSTNSTTTTDMTSTTSTLSFFSSSSSTSSLSTLPSSLRSRPASPTSGPTSSRHVTAALFPSTTITQVVLAPPLSSSAGSDSSPFVSNSHSLSSSMNPPNVPSLDPNSSPSTSFLSSASSAPSLRPTPPPPITSNSVSPYPSTLYSNSLPLSEPIPVQGTLSETMFTSPSALVLIATPAPAEPTDVPITSSPFKPEEDRQSTTTPINTKDNPANMTPRKVDMHVNISDDPSITTPSAHPSSALTRPAVLSPTAPIPLTPSFLSSQWVQTITVLPAKRVISENPESTSSTIPTDGSTLEKDQMLVSAKGGAGSELSHPSYSPPPSPSPPPPAPLSCPSSTSLPSSRNTPSAPISVSEQAENSVPLSSDLTSINSNSNSNSNAVLRLPLPLTFPPAPAPVAPEALASFVSSRPPSPPPAITRLLEDGLSARRILAPKGKAVSQVKAANEIDNILQTAAAAALANAGMQPGDLTFPVNSDHTLTPSRSGRTSPLPSLTSTDGSKDRRRKGLFTPTRNMHSPSLPGSRGQSPSLGTSNNIEGRNTPNRLSPLVAPTPVPPALFTAINTLSALAPEPQPPSFILAYSNAVASGHGKARTGMRNTFVDFSNPSTTSNSVHHDQSSQLSPPSSPPRLLSSIPSRSPSLRSLKALPPLPPTLSTSSSSLASTPSSQPGLTKRRHAPARVLLTDYFDCVVELISHGARLDLKNRYVTPRTFIFPMIQTCTSSFPYPLTCRFVLFTFRHPLFSS